MFLALLAVSFLASYILLNMNIGADRIATERARQTAWLMREVAQAARLYVRDNSVSTSSVFHRNNLCATRRAVRAQDLVTGGYISPNIGRIDPTGTFYETPMRQQLHIVAANSIINPALCAPNQLTNIAASAYLVVQPGTFSANSDLINLSESLHDLGLPALPALYQGGVNTSPNCGGGPATFRWDTGCLSPTQYSFLNGGTPFAEGTFGMPAWLTFRGDTRAIFRFPQPENPQAQQMATDLRMSTSANTDPASCTQVMIRTADPALLVGNATATHMVPSGVCVVNDDTGINDNRRNINNARNVTFKRAIITPQGTDNESGAVVTESGAELDRKSVV